MTEYASAFEDGHKKTALAPLESCDQPVLGFAITSIPPWEQPGNGPAPPTAAGELLKYIARLYH
jgi:hypothetical protein